MKKIINSVYPYQPAKPYAQYLYRTKQKASFDTWLEFMGKFNRKKKIAIPLRIIQGGDKTNHLKNS